MRESNFRIIQQNKNSTKIVFIKKNNEESGFSRESFSQFSPSLLSAISDRSEGENASSSTYQTNTAIDAELERISEQTNTQDSTNESPMFSLGNYDPRPQSNIYNNSRYLNESFTFSTLSSLISRSNKALGDINVSVLSHEILKLRTLSNGKTDSNMLFLSSDDFVNNTFEKLKSNEIQKYESFADRFFVYSDIDMHFKKINKGFEKQKNILENLDIITSISNQLENEINYGNIVKNFFKEGQGIYNGKIINTLLSDTSLYTSEAGQSDERFIDKQDKVYNSITRVDDLKLFYNNVLGFNFRENISNFENSLTKFEIENTDRLIGQLFVNLGIANYSVFPNTDNITSEKLLRKRDRLNHVALNRFPIIQTKDLSLNSRIFGFNNDVPRNAANLEILAVSNNRLNTDLIFKNIPEETLISEGIQNHFNNIINSYGIKDFSKFLRGSTNQRTVQARDPGTGRLLTQEFVYRQRKSLLGKFHENYQTNLFNNNIFNINIVTDRTGPFSDQGINYSYKRLYDKIILDSDNDTKNVYMSPSFLILSTRYFANDLLTRQLEKIKYGTYQEGETRVNPIVISSNSEYSGIDNVKSKLKSNFFNNFELVSDPLTNAPDYRFEDQIGNSDADLSKSEREASFENYKLSLEKGFRYISDFLSQIYRKLDSEFKNYEVEINLEESENSSEEDFLDAYFFNNRLNAESSYYNEDGDLLLRREDEVYINEIIDQDLTETGVLNLFNTSISDQGTNNYDDLNYKNDCTVFSASNSILSKKDLINIGIISRIPAENDSYSGKDLKRIKTNQQKIINTLNLTEGVKNVSINNSFSKKIFLKSASIISSIKRNLSKDSLIFDSFIAKSRQKILQGESFSLLYDNFIETSFDTFENSPFIQKKNYKNNFSKPFTEIDNTTSLMISAEDDIKDDHIMTSKQFREHLSKIYTKSFFRSKSLFFNKVLKDNIQIITESEYENDTFFGFDLMLAKSLSNNNKIDASSIKSLVKVLLTNAILKLAGIDNQISVLKSKPSFSEFNYNVDYDLNYIITKEAKRIFSESVYNDVLRLVFNPKNLYDNKNYVIRSTKKVAKDKIFNSITPSSGRGGVNFNYIPGYICNLKFPFLTSTFDFEGTSLCNKVENFSAYFIKSILANKNESGEVVNFSALLNDLSLYNKNILVAASNSLYNYDIFIDENESGIVNYTTGDNDKTQVNSYSFSRETQNIGSELKISYLSFNHINKGNLSSIETVVNDENGEIKTYKDEITLPYENSSILMPFSYFYLAEKENTFSKKITDIAIDLLKVFNVDLSNINNVSQALEFIESNSFYSRVLQDIFEINASVFTYSYENYIGLIVDDIRKKSIEPNCSYEDFQKEVKKFTFVNGNEEIKKLCVSDLKKVLEINLENIASPNFIKEDFSYEHTNDQFSSNVFYTERLPAFQIVSKLLKNSDIAEVMSHDILHGYFLNFEDNIKKEQENAELLGDAIKEIEDEISLIDGIEEINFKKLLLDEFYQNYVSRNIQELIFYKNLFNENFIKNNTFNSTKEKYESINFFDHLKIYNENKFNKSKQGLQKISSFFDNDQSRQDLDILRFPVSYDLAKKVGLRGIIKISILPVNLKYPEIEYEQLDYFYCPVLTDVTSNFVSSLGDSFNNFIGFYNDAKKVSERYCIVSKEDAIAEIRLIIEEIFIRLSETSLRNIEIDIDRIAEKVVTDSIASSAIKSLNFVSQGQFDEEVKNVSVDINNLISEDTSQLISSIDSFNFKKIFDNFIEEDLLNIQDREGIFQIDNNKAILDNMELYKKFLHNLDKDMSSSDVLVSLLPTVFYDTFDIAINREKLNIVDSEEEVLERSSKFNLDDDKNKCFNYYIEAKVL